MDSKIDQIIYDIADISLCLTQPKKWAEVHKNTLASQKEMLEEIRKINSMYLKLGGRP